MKMWRQISRYLTMYRPFTRPFAECGFQVERAEMEVQVVKAKQRRQELKCSVQEEPHWPEPDEQPFHCNLCGKPGKELSKLQKGSIRVSRVVLGGSGDLVSSYIR